MRRRTLVAAEVQAADAVVASADLAMLDGLELLVSFSQAHPRLSPDCHPQPPKETTSRQRSRRTRHTTGLLNKNTAALTYMPSRRPVAVAPLPLEKQEGPS